MTRGFPTQEVWNSISGSAADPLQIRCMEPPLTREDAMGEFMFLGLRMSSGVSRVEFERNFGCSMESVYGRTLEKYCSLGLLAEERQRVFPDAQGNSCEQRCNGRLSAVKTLDEQMF